MTIAIPMDRLAHARGKAYRDVVRNLTGDVAHVPDLVVRPESEQHVIDVLDWCSRDGIAVIPFGGGSSVVGGVEPRFAGYPGVVAFDLERLNRGGPDWWRRRRPAHRGHSTGRVRAELRLFGADRPRSPKASGRE